MSMVQLGNFHHIEVFQILKRQLAPNSEVIEPLIAIKRDATITFAAED